MFARRIVALLFVAVPLGCAEPGDPMLVPMVVRDFPLATLRDAPAETRDDAPVSVGVVSPALHYSRDGAGMPSVILSPPAEVAFVAAAPDAPGTLRGRAGIDVSAARYLGPDRARIEVRFEVLVDGAVEFEQVVRLEHVPGSRVGSEWVDVGGVEGIDVAAGQRVTLRTRAVDLDGTDFVPPVPLVAGFGGLHFERVLELERQRSSPERPNLVLVVMDTLRADRLGTYGYDRPTSPRLDAFAARGTTYDAAYATSSWTWPSTASILTGLESLEHGVRDRSSCYLATSLDTVAEVAQRAGLTTAAWSGNPLVSPQRNFHQGFEQFSGVNRFRKTDAFFPEVEAWLREHAGTRFFLYLQLVEPHHPYAPLPDAKAELAPDADARVVDLLPEQRDELMDGSAHVAEVVTPDQQRDYDALYDASVRSGDVWFGRLLDLLEELDLTGETIVVFTSDHGEELFERGMVGHGQGLHTELVRTPLVLAGPGVPVGARVAEPVSNRHLAPTLAGLAGAVWSEDTSVDLASARVPTREVFFSTETGFWGGGTNRGISGVRTGPWTYQAFDGEEGREARLFRVDEDPLERVDLAAGRPADLERVGAIHDARRAEQRPRVEGRGLAAGQATLELLRRVGYLGDD